MQPAIDFVTARNGTAAAEHLAGLTELVDLAAEHAVLVLKLSCARSTGASRSTRPEIVLLVEASSFSPSVFSAFTIMSL